MPVYKTFFKIAYRSILTIIIYFVIFAVLSFFMSYSGRQSAEKSFQTKSLDISVIDRDQTPASAALASYLDYYHELVPLEDNDEVLQDNLYYDTVSYILIIPEGYASNLEKQDFSKLTEHVTVPDTASGVFIDGQISNYLGTLKLYLASGESLADALTRTAEACEPEHLVEAISAPVTAENQTSSTRLSFYFRYLAYILLIVPLNSMTPILTAFKDSRIAKRMNCSALPLRRQFLELNLASITYTFLLWALFLILAAIVFRTDFFTPMGLLQIFNSFILMLVSTCVTLFVSNFSPKGATLSIISNLFTLGSCFLCGIFVPMDLLGKNVLAVGQFLPVYWYSKAVNMVGDMCGEVYSTQSYWTCIGVQCAFIAALLALTLATAKLMRNSRRECYSINTNKVVG